MKLEKIVTWFLILASAYLAYQIILKLTGHSWVMESIMGTMILIHMGMTWKLMKEVSEINAKMERHLGWHEGKKR